MMGRKFDYDAKASCRASGDCSFSCCQKGCFEQDFSVDEKIHHCVCFLNDFNSDAGANFSINEAMVVWSTAFLKIGALVENMLSRLKMDVIH
jgi:hypothetical protein